MRQQRPRGRARSSSRRYRESRAAARSPRCRIRTWCGSPSIASRSNRPGNWTSFCSAFCLSVLGNCACRPCRSPATTRGRPACTSSGVGDRGGGRDNGGRVLAPLAEPAQQHVAAERHARRDDRPAMRDAQAPQDPVDFVAVGEMIEARQRFSGPLQLRKCGTTPCQPRARAAAISDAA